MRFLKRYCRVVATILLVMMTFAGCYSAEETVTVEKISGFTYELSPKSRKPVSDVYAMTTGADEVDVYVPTDMLTGTGGKTPEIIVMMGEKEIHTVSNLTNDGKYVGATIYRRDYEGPIEFSVYVREE